MIVYFSYDLCFYQLCDFLLDGFVPIWGLTSLLLPYRGASLTNIQSMFRYGSWNSYYIHWLLGEYIQVVLEQVAQLHSSFLRQASAYGNDLLWIFRMECFFDSLICCWFIWGRNLSIEGMAWIFWIPGLPMILLYGDSDFTTMKFIRALVECFASPSDTINDIFP
ncbi:hypothetical protein Tco_1317059 [Tanacetum coccineum]